jgi:dTDP-3-amino-3,4,6-trideoxy-alpha-D-glucose transaminase
MIEVPFFDLGQSVRTYADELHACLDEVLATGYFVGGSLVSRFEGQFAGLVGTTDCVGVGNGLDAIRMILEAYEVGIGDEVIVPAFTFYATWLGVTQTGATPVPVDVLPGTANLDPAGIEAAITARTKAIIPVHLYGQAADMLSITAIAKRHGLLVVEDAAQAHAANSNAGVVGAVSDAAAFSFYPTKNLGALGDAGAVTTSDPSVADRIRSRRSYGQGKSKYDHIDTGWNSRLDPLQAAFLSLHLKKLDQWTARRREIASAYSAALGDRRSSAIGPVDLRGSVWHHFVVKATRRAELQKYFSDNGVGTDVHYPYAVHELDPMRKLMPASARSEEFPVALALSRQVTSLPMGPWMSDEQVERVASTLGEVPDGLLVG